MLIRPRSTFLPLVVVFACILGLRGQPVTARSQGALSPRQQPQDLGPTSSADTLTASVILKVRNPDQLEALAAATQDPDSPQYHRFLTAAEFTARFSPTAGDIALITRYLGQFGIAVTDVYPNRLLLRISGPADAFNSAFSLDMHDFVRGPRHFHRPRNTPRIPELLRDLLVTIVGPNTEPQFKPALRHAASAAFKGARALPVPGALATGQPGDYTVGDVAAMYDINPLYNAHVTGAGRTVGIVTLAGFHPEDAYAYWSDFGVSTSQNRITQVHVDGGGETSADAGSAETSLDVEQSGGVAPAAAVRVYDAPNQGAGFMDAFYLAISQNVVDSLSTSWGSAEPFYDAAVSGVDTTGQLLAFHQVFLEAGVQGISVFASTGDSGAYDMNDGLNDCCGGVPLANVLTVDAPGSDPAITAAGGTTTPVEILFQGAPQPILIPQEQVWGWDYLAGLFGVPAVFPAGTGGGVSVFWHRPVYQAGTPGVRNTEPNQSIVTIDPSSGQPVDLLDLPGHFPGRNLPDVSLNADPFTGYIIYSSEDGFFLDGFGGTSFVAPQLNGITALLAQSAHGRIGFWNPMLYRFRHQYGHGPQSPLVDIVGGDNWFYAGIPGYEPGAGLGVIDVAKLAAAVDRDSRGW